MTFDPLFNYLDLTYLGNDENEAHEFITRASNLPLAAVCISPQFVKLAKNALSHPIASVVNFPTGDSSSRQVHQEINELLYDNIDEIDIVFPYKQYLSGEKEQALKHFSDLIKPIPPNVTLKVIIESGEIKDQTHIKTLCLSLTKLPIHFIKTSTGKTAVGATIESATTILSCLKNTKIGIKVSGGIRTMRAANEYFQLTKSQLNEATLSTKQFRIGASLLKAD